MRKQNLQRWVIPILICGVLASVIFCIHNKFKESSTNFEHFSSIACARIDFNRPSGIESKLVTGKIGTLTRYLQALDLQKSQTPFKEDWIFCITLNCHELVPNGDETIIFVNEHSIQIEDTNYDVNGDISTVLDNLKVFFDQI